MRYLPDVSTLIAYGLQAHEFHSRVASWLGGLVQSENPEMITCPITELGFVRVLAQRYGFTVAKARSLLAAVLANPGLRFIFVPDDRRIAQLPSWVQFPKQVTDGHLAELAQANAAVVAALDSRIPGAFLIPCQPEETSLAATIVK